MPSRGWITQLRNVTSTRTPSVKVYHALVSMRKWLVVHGDFEDTGEKVRSDNKPVALETFSWKEVNCMTI